ncbi:MAG: Vacuolar protein-sorting-associated protein 28 [Vezdaea acicularis]|nr:MAG: Vacuolar protein-sorting-associated protein 28 [Vezdaea acicularis]
MLNSRPQPYAPTPYSYNPSLTASIPLDEELKLSTNNQEREVYDNLAEIYSVIVTLEALEKAYIRDSLKENEYTEACDRLLKQYKAILADENVARHFGDLETFKRDWEVECPRATERLRIGLPATVERGSSQAAATSNGSHGSGVTSAALFDAAETFITFIDAVKLEWLAKDTLHPLLGEVIKSVNKVTEKDFEGRGKIVQWLITLNGMKATEELNKEQARELMFDMTEAYNGFRETMK